MVGSTYLLYLAARHAASPPLDHITVSQGVWNGKASTPKTQSAIRTVAVSGILAKLLYLQKVFQEEKGHDYLFSTSTGSPWDMNMFRKRKMKPLLCLLGIQHAGLHAFRQFNASLLGSLRVALKTIQERLGHASGGFLTLDVYTHAEKKEDIEAAQRVGEAIRKAMHSVSLPAIQIKGLPILKSEALAA